jgi:probable HAF family extracellular repeat protein
LLLSVGGALAQYTVTAIADGPEWLSSEGWAINNLGDIAGYGATASGEYRAFVYRQGRVTTLDTLGGIFNWAYALNDLGEVAGMSFPAPPVWDLHAFLYRTGSMWDIGAGFVGNSTAFGLNNAGQVVGFVPSADVSAAFLRETNGTFRLLAMNDACAYAINDLGHVAGRYKDTNGVSQAFLYRNGILLGLGLLEGGVDAVARALNNLDEVVGDATAGDGTRHVFFWRDGRMEDLGPGYAYGINDLGQVVGLRNEDGFIYDRFRGWRNLNHLLPSHSGWTILQVLGINQTGQIVGLGQQGDVNQPVRAVLLTPPPTLWQPRRMASNRLEFMVQSLPGRTNQIEYSANLANWTALTNFVSTQLLTRCEFSLEAGRGFFRARTP